MIPESEDQPRDGHAAEESDGRDSAPTREEHPSEDVVRRIRLRPKWKKTFPPKVNRINPDAYNIYQWKKQQDDGTDKQTRRNFLRLGLAVGGLVGCDLQQRGSTFRHAIGRRRAIRPAAGHRSGKVELDQTDTVRTRWIWPITRRLPTTRPTSEDETGRIERKYVNVKKVPGMCQLCSTVCGIVGYVKNGRLIKIEGNPKDPNSRGHLCARGHAGLNHLYHPERLLFPLKRIGKRGEGKWKRISWDEALDEIADKLRGRSRKRQARGVCLSSRSTTQQGRIEAFSGCLRHQDATQSPSPLFWQSASRQL